METDVPTLRAIYRYPVKGLSAEPLQETTLEASETVPGDRLYAIENGPSGFDASAPRHYPKTHYLMLMRNGRLAKLHTRFDHVTHALTLNCEGRTVTVGDLRKPEGRSTLERFFAVFCADELRGTPKVLFATGFSFSDVAFKAISIINLASVAELENLVGRPVHPLRFRANLYVSGWPAWYELGLVGKEVAIGAHARLKIVKRIVRCAATNVDPDTGNRDLAIPDAIRKVFGHADCGIYGIVISAGAIAVGDQVSVAETSS